MACAVAEENGGENGRTEEEDDGEELIKEAPRARSPEDQSKRKVDSRITKLRRRISQGLRLSFAKDDEEVFAEKPNVKQNSPAVRTNIFSESDIETCTETKKPVVRRTVSDTVGGRLRKISSFLSDSRRHSDEFTSGEFESTSSQPLSPSYGRLESYQKLEPLGEGSYATVFKGICTANRKVVALKEIRLQEEEGAPFTAIREASLLKQLKQANIVRLHDIIHTKDTLMFVFEFIDTDLNSYLERYPRGVCPNNAKIFIFQLLRGLAYIHQRKILHRDIKPQNLLISEKGELKLADFGLARAKSVPSRTYSNEVVTLWYRPPDVLLGSKDYTTSLDIWAAGCIFVEMITGVALFPGLKDHIDQLNKIWQVLGTPTNETWPGVTKLAEYNIDTFLEYPPQRLGYVVPRLLGIDGAEKLASLMIQLDPKLRVTAKNAIHNSYFSDFPKEVYTISEEDSIFTVSGIEYQKEPS
ncbi:cyclin-dependent kinase 14-like [Actinia tenebrosa]|uniref:cyclin-dependent kinase n=1 Tax=Actinia tenebrosa TaxID=6105 RepID=A0A6P8IL13_ACTTE|nr:cyclin-dependent kinase 14-like [Actinia tenebrosa]XP_031567659.1 cyclin-dependent kinase 14-like [Actinia tenebrosa]